MILSDFVSRQKHNDSNPHEIITILITCKAFYDIDIIIKAKEMWENI